jgi:ribose 5-phosphate isomerase B
MHTLHIHIASDHAGVSLKSHIKDFLGSLGSDMVHSIQDYGTHQSDSCDYPDYVHPLAQAMDSGDGHLGILICGSGNGVCMTANKYPYIRAALCWNTELATLARQHNNANVICIPARFVDETTATAMVELFLTTPFEGGRHAGRVDKIAR